MTEYVWQKLKHKFVFLVVVLIFNCLNQIGCLYGALQSIATGNSSKFGFGAIVSLQSACVPDGLKYVCMHVFLWPKLSALYGRIGYGSNQFVSLRTVYRCQIDHNSHNARIVMLSIRRSRQFVSDRNDDRFFFCPCGNSTIGKLRKYAVFAEIHVAHNQRKKWGNHFIRICRFCFAVLN